MFGIKTKKEMDSVDDIREVQKKFLSEISYDVRNPLNEICGITEIAIKNLENNGDPEMLKSYLEIIQEAGFELQRIVDERFEEFENQSDKIVKEETVVSETDSKEKYRILNNLRIMVVEDSETAGMIARELLQDYGSIVTVAETGEEAVDKFEKAITGTYDVIFMDIKMPGIDGYEATYKIRNSNHPQAKSIPIIAMTADTLASDIQKALNSGMNAHISKPICIDKIVGAIKKSLN